MLVPEIIKPKLVALDSSHLGDFARDYYSANTAVQAETRVFERKLRDHGYILVLSWHHLQELLTHEDEIVIERRLQWLCSQKMLAWVRSPKSSQTVGSILDILAHEVRAAYRSPDSDVNAIRKQVAMALFYLDSGLNVIAPFAEHWKVLKPLLVKRQKREREIVAISQSDFADISKTRVRDWMQGRLRNRRDIAEQFRKMAEHLAIDIRSRGDKRIEDSKEIASEFLQDLERSVANIPRTVAFVTQFLASMDISESEITEEMTLEDIGSLASFRRKLRIANDILDLPWIDLRSKVRMECLPSVIIQTALTKYGQQLIERRGSELADNYLACLAAYVDVCYVDKRTHENFRRAREKSVEFAAIIGRLEKAATRIEIARQLGLA